MACSIAVLAAFLALAAAGDILGAPGKFGSPALVQRRPGFKAVAPAFPSSFGGYDYPKVGYPVAKPAVKKAVYPAATFAGPAKFDYGPPKAVYPARKDYDGPFDNYGYAPLRSNAKFAYPVKNDYDYKPVYPVKSDYQPVYPVKKVNTPFDYPVVKKDVDYRPGYDYDYKPVYDSKPDYRPAFDYKNDYDYKPDYPVKRVVVDDYITPVDYYPKNNDYLYAPDYPKKVDVDYKPVYARDVYDRRDYKPAFPARAVYPAKPVYPVNTVYPAKAVYPAKPVYPAKAVYPAREVYPYPAKAVYPASNVYDRVPRYPVKAVAPVAPVKKVAVAKAPVVKSKFPSFDSFGKEFGKVIGRRCQGPNSCC
ncbi:hypothetical protein RRG08_048642 [Elysia crispata]|uniref:Uncharacterized protein n=1 Tax=Elysia crispata TaxID=231223 RepID=A0AAE1ADC0_9GAST|nr:hypothetical protein RRG08_048642 [Elysia crispata]